MTIRYSLTLGELVAWFFARLRHQRQPHPIVIYWQWLALILLACVVAFSVRNSHLFPLSPGKQIDSADYFDLAAPFVGLLGPLLTYWLLLRHVTLSIGSKGVVVKHPVAPEVDVRWRDVTVLESDSRLITFGAKFPRLQATYYAIPIRAFSSAAKAQAFFGKATDYWNAATGLSAETSQAWPPAPTTTGQS